MEMTQARSATAGECACGDLGGATAEIALVKKGNKVVLDRDWDR